MLRERTRRRNAARTSSRRKIATEQLQQIKLEDGVRLHESVKVELETYARQVGDRIVKPFVLVIGRATRLMLLN